MTKLKKTKKTALIVIILIVLAGMASSFYIKTDGLTFFQRYQNVTNPYVRYVNIAAGMRKEQIAERFAKTLEWDEDDIHQFINVKTELEDQLNIEEGYYYPETYLVPIDGGGDEIARTMIDTFNEKIIEQYAKSPANIRNLDTALTIASLIQREAAGKRDMKLISGIIWNRIFHNMPLQIDATVQYAKGTEGNWWPRVNLKDVKEINSPYNTYHIDGLPPSPISNPGMDAIDAALNPQKTDCLFYFHDDNRVIHCSVTGAEHVRKVKQYFGN